MVNSNYTAESFDSIVQLLLEKYKDWDGKAQFTDTPRRLAELYNEFCWSPEKIEEELNKHTRLFEDGYDEALSTSEIDVKTLCPHHLLPCTFKVTIKYKPNQKVLGLSKFTRIAVILGKHPVMQETYTRELADTLFERIKPYMVEVKVKGTHGCVQYRGALQNVEIETKVSRGSCDEKPLIVYSGEAKL